MVNTVNVSTYLTKIVDAKNTGGIEIAFLSFTNTTNSTAILNAYIVKKGQEASNNNIIIKSLEFPKDETLISEGERIYLSDGDSLLARCEVGSITAVCSYKVG